MTGEARDTQALEKERVTALARRLDPLLLGAAVLAALVLVGQLARGRIDPVSVGIPLVACATFLLARRLPAAARVTAIVVGVPVVALALLANGVAAWLEYRSPMPSTDPRPVAQAVLDLRAAGHPEAVPPSKAWAYLAEPLVVDGVATVPLAGLPDALEVLCSEGGPWRSYGTDRFGFTNPDTVWETPADLVLLGDSFTQGFCVAADESFAGRLRAVHPRTVNLGGGANGPLVELATLVEFGARARGRVVLWFFFEANDFDNLLEEARQPILRGYLESGHSQRLLERMAAVHAAQRASSEQRMGEWFQPVAQPGAWNELLRFAKLGHLRTRLGMFRHVEHPYDSIDGAAVAALLPDVARRIAQEAAAGGAHAALVYLPGRAAFTGRGLHPLRPLLLDAAAAAELPVVDVIETFRRDPDPAGLYSSPRDWGHLTPEGNRLVAERVLGEIDRRGWLATPR